MSKREYIIANRKWLEEKAKEEGVEALPNGIYYKVLKSGDPDGAQPQKRSIVTVHYTGWTIDGKKSSIQALAAPRLPCDSAT